MMEYYPARTPTIATLNREIPGFNVVDHLEEQRSVWPAVALETRTAHIRACRMLILSSVLFLRSMQIERR